MKNLEVSHLRYLAAAFPDMSVSRARAQLLEDLGASHVDFVGLDSCAEAENMPLSRAINLVRELVVHLAVHSDLSKSLGGVQNVLEPLDKDRVPAFVRAFQRARGASEFMWAGYLISTLIPENCGLDPVEAKGFLQWLTTRGVVSTTKRPNPKRPGSSTTCVHLNLEHAWVRESITDAAARSRPSSTPRHRLRVRGGAVSETILGERR